MTPSEAYDFAIEIFKEEEGREPVMVNHDNPGNLSRDEIALSVMHVAIVHTLRNFNNLSY